MLRASTYARLKFPSAHPHLREALLKDVLARTAQVRQAGGRRHNLDDDDDDLVMCLSPFLSQVHKAQRTSPPFRRP